MSRPLLPLLQQGCIPPFLSLTLPSPVSQPLSCFLFSAPLFSHVSPHTFKSKASANTISSRTHLTGLSTRLSLRSPVALECLGLATQKRTQKVEYWTQKKALFMVSFLSFTPHSLIYTCPSNSPNPGKLKLQFSETKVTCSATNK